jgi:hypothetical protein
MRSSRNCLTVHATGGEVANHLCMRESWIDPIVNIVEVLGVGCLGASEWQDRLDVNASRRSKRASLDNDALCIRVSWCVRIAVQGKMLRKV